MGTRNESGGRSAPAWIDMEKLFPHVLDDSVLEILLSDHSRPKKGRKAPHIIWATEACPSGQISTGDAKGILPRTGKSKEEQQMRVRDRGEVFTPSWICNSQNNLVDDAWFGASGIFNEETPNAWKPNTRKVPFPAKDGKGWQDYVADIRLEITCGEAPYIVSRYDAITGEAIPVEARIGLLDRKLRVVSENAASPEEWLEWTLRAFQSTYAYEWQGDSLLLARENALFSFFDHYSCRFGNAPARETVLRIAEIISCNFWQMDGLKGVIPGSCTDRVEEIPTLFGEPETVVTPCEGCAKDDIRLHNGVYCRIMDWESGETVRYIDLIKR